MLGSVLVWSALLGRRVLLQITQLRTATNFAGGTLGGISNGTSQTESRLSCSQLGFQPTPPF
jgi:chorismate synthase